MYRIKTIGTRVSAEAWNDLVEQYRDRGGKQATDYELAEMLREKIEAAEG